MKRSGRVTPLTFAWFITLILFPIWIAVGQGDGEPQLGTPGRPSYETFRMDKITSQGEASYGGNLNLSIPLLIVPGRHGHDFAINISYNSHITQSQLASWVGLGWDLDIGAVERTIVGRADDQDPVYNQQHGYWLGPNPGAFCGPPYRATMYGKMNIREKTLALADRDQADLYDIIIDGGSTEAHFIPDLTTDTTNYHGPYKFLAPQYRTWDITATWTPSAGPVSAFAITKEDGSKYVFGQDGSNNGSIDNIEVAGKTQDGSGYNQQFSFPYRWSLEQITYPDGSNTRVTYKKHNQGTQNSVRRKYASIGVDRSYSWVDNVFSPGISVVPHSQDSVRYWYSSPESLYTDTHYLVFKSSSPSSIDFSAKNRRLDTLILYDRLSGRELKRVLFFYAANPNPNSIGNDLNSWQRGTSLANDQLTLDSVSVRTSDDRYADAVPPFIFAYNKNPKFDLNYNQNGAEGGNYVFPGYRTDTVFSTAWRLKSIQFPTGGRTEYSYQRLSGDPSDQYKVCYDPEGRYNASYPYSFNAVPRCRLAQKRVVDTLGINQVWTYTYGTAVYDAPCRPVVGTYQPDVYTSAKDPNYNSIFSYYMYYRGCPIGHRWVQVTFPNGSWKKTYFTSSYKAADKDPMESQPDSILQGSIPNNATVITSNYAKRALIWKEETNLTSAVYYYSHQIQWQYLDPYVYFALCDNNNYSYQIQLRSIWPHLDSVRTTTDGITNQTYYTYNPTRISNYGVWNKTGYGSSPYYPGWQAGIAANGLLARKDVKWNGIIISTSYQYASSRNSSIDAAFMLSQVYSTKVSDTVDESRDWTTYGQIGSLWLPISRWVWSDDHSLTVAPPDTSTGVNVTLVRYGYDGSSCTDIVKTTDANGNITNFYYSSDTTNPFSNNAAGLAMGRVTGVEKIRGGSMSPLRTSAIYDGYGNATKLTSENGNVTRCIYDKLGRLTSIVGPNGQTISDYSYSYFVSPLQPSKIAASSYRTPADWTSSRTYYDGIGYEIEKQISLGPLDLITRTAYDSMRHPAQQFLPYQCDLGGSNEHNYDTSVFSRTMAYNPGSGWFPYDLTEYERDPNGRTLNQFYSGTVFSNSDRVNNKYTRLYYGANGTGLPDFASGTLHKTTTLDENGHNRISYTDNLGNTVASVADSGGRALTTKMEYDPKGRVINIFTPNSYNPPMSRLSTGLLDLYKPGHTGQIDLTGLRIGGKAISISLFADTMNNARPILAGEEAQSNRTNQGIRPLLPFGGITVVFNINQYSKGTLIAHQDSTTLWDYPDSYPGTSPTPPLPLILPEADEVKLVIDTVYWIVIPPGRNFDLATLTLNCGVGGDFSYTYDKRGLTTQKVVPDLGASSLLYDKNGNIRFVKDAAHTATAGNYNGPCSNNVHSFGSINCPNSTSGQFTLTMPGPVTATTHVYDIDNSEYVTIKIKANGVYLISTSSSGFNGSTCTLPLPKGTYTYEVTTTGIYGAFSWDVSCQNGYEFVYYKYDALNRVTEQGEYLSTSAFANFFKGNAENTSFPASGAPTRTMLYDTVSTDAFASGQRNLRGKLSQATYYRLGTLALSTFYSYDDFGRVEWVAYRGFSSNGMKLAYTYDLQNNITKKTFTDYANTNNQFFWWYEYDQAGRLARIYSGADSLSRVKDAEYAYSASGKVAQLNLGVTPAQTLAYTYTDRNWLSSITSAKFWEHLGYNTIAEIGATLGSPAQYNGNVSWMSYSESGNGFHWGPPDSTTILGYSFRYDSTNRLIAGNFGFNFNGWSSWNSYIMPKIGYDKNGNIDTLVRYGSNATLMDNLKYHYLGNTDRLDYISDRVPSSTFTADIDSQRVGNYRYDSNGNVQADSGSGMGFIIYDINNLPVAEYKRDGTAIQYVYDNNGQRASKLVGSAYVWYVPGADGKTEVLYNNSNTDPTFNLWGNANAGQVRRTGTALARYYYLQDHLGTNRMTYQGDRMTLADNFGGTLSGWTTVMGGGYCLQNGELADSSGGDNVLVNSSSWTFGDGIIGADVKTLSGDYTDANLVVRYQDVSNFYLIQVYGGQVIIFKRVAGTYYAQASVGISPHFTGGFYRLQATVIGGAFTVYWKGQQVLTWTDTSPWTSGKVGVRQCNGRNIHWDNFSAVTYSTGQVVAFDDFYPFGQLMDGRSMVSGADGRYKYTGKERDAETGWDYFGARYYDARIGRWLSVDPSAQEYPSLSPFRFSFNNPLRFFDPDGSNEKERNTAVQTARTMIGTPYVHGGMSKSGFDCSGLVRYCMTQNKTIADPIGLYEEGDNGVATIIKASTPIELNQLEVGNVVVIRSGGRDDGHVAFISEVTRDDNGNVVSYKIIHAEAAWTNDKSGESGGGDVNESNIVVGGQHGYSKEIFHQRFYKWDSPENTSTASNQGKNQSAQSDQGGEGWRRIARALIWGESFAEKMARLLGLN